MYLLPWTEPEERQRHSSVVGRWRDERVVLEGSGGFSGREMGADGHSSSGRRSSDYASESPVGSRNPVHVQFRELAERGVLHVVHDGVTTPTCEKLNDWKRHVQGGKMAGA